MVKKGFEMDLSIIIVNYNTRELTLQCISSIYESNIDNSFEVFVVDNNSSDNSVEAIRQQFPNVILIENTRNVGFSKANNQAIKQATGAFVLLLNSDTIVKENTLSIMLQYMKENEDVGAAGCEVLLPDGTLDKACHRGFPTPSASFYYMTGLAKKYSNNPRFNLYHKSYLNMDEIHEIDCLVGAFMIVRAKTIQEVGMLDETFFMYGEDIDWCYRIKEAGWDIIYNPTVSIIHYKGASSRKKPAKIVYEFHRAMYLFHKKHYAKKHSFFTNAIVYTGITVKLSLELLKNKAKNN